jgi:hypothetical protein
MEELSTQEMLSRRGGVAVTMAQIEALLAALLHIHIPHTTAAHIHSTVGNTNTAVAVRMVSITGSGHTVASQSTIQNVGNST